MKKLKRNVLNSSAMSKLFGGKEIPTSKSGTNSSGFTALLGGNRDTVGNFFNRAISGYWWSSTESSATNAVHRGIDSSNVGISRNPNIPKAQSFCLRCLKD